MKDLTKGISKIEYNVLNSPQRILFTHTSNPVNEYVYTASGAKLSVIHKSSTEKRTDYVGNMIYENGSLKRILVDGGYIENGVYHFYLQDHLGNNRIVAKADGTVVQTNHYYPYGMSFAESMQTSNQPYKYNGKELDTEYGLNWYDYEARQMESAFSRFTSIDPLAEKYYAISPYVYVASNPIRNIDKKGDSITVLNMNNGQHIALLIKNMEINKWQYYSINGDNVYILGKHSGGREFNDLDIGEFDSPQQFLESDYNSKGDKNDITINSYGFDEGYIILTTPDQDNIIRTTFVDIANNEEYSLNPISPNQCATVVQKSLNKAGVDTRTSQTITNRSTGGDSYQIKINSFLPSVTFRAIISNNPNGKYIRR